MRLMEVVFEDGKVFLLIAGDGEIALIVTKKLLGIIGQDR